MTDASTLSEKGGFSIGTIFLGILVLTLGSTAFGLAVILILFTNLGMDDTLTAIRQTQWLALFTAGHLLVLAWACYLAGKRSLGGEYLNSVGIGLYAVGTFFLFVKMKPLLVSVSADPTLYPDWYLEANLVLSLPFALVGAYCARRSNYHAIVEAIDNLPRG